MMTDREQKRSALKEILYDRWSLDQQDGWDYYGEDTLDEIMAVFGE